MIHCEIMQLLPVLSMTPSTTYTAGIVCKKVTLTINGTGALNIISTTGGNGALDYGDGSDCVCEISGGSSNGGAPNDIIYLYRQKIH